MSLEVLVLLFICCCLLISQINAQCLIEMPQDVRVRPKFFKNIEISATLIPVGNQNIWLDNDETITGYCTNQFATPGNAGQTLTIECENNKIYYHDILGLRSWPGSAELWTECTPEITFEKCTIHLASDKAVRPKIFKKVGARNIQLSPEVQTITIKHYEELTAQCDTKFKSPSQQNPELNLICLGSRIVALGHPFNGNFSELECGAYKWNLYDSKISFTWCPSTMASYILARPLAENDYEYLAGICYDFEQMSFRSIYYAAKPKSEKHLAPRYLDSFAPLIEVTDIEENFISKKTYVYDNPQMLKWFSFSNYKTDSILQSPSMHIEFLKQFDKLLNIDWWLGLKLGNWLLYEEALEKHVENENQDYDILAGISREVAVPIRKENCSKNITMVDIVDSGNNKLPLYVWNYLRSSTNSSDDVVVIGVNTPLSDFYDEKELLFCNDICHKIDWLSDVLMTFHYRPMGIIFCCTVDEVLASARLDGLAVPAELITPTLLPILNYRAITANSSSAKASESDEREQEYDDETTERDQEYDEYANIY